MSCLLCNSKIVSCIHHKLDKTFGEKNYYSCNNCKLIFLLPQDRLKPKSEKERYDNHQNDPSDKNYINFLQRLTSPLISKLTNNACGLDFGCGPGPSMSAIFKNTGHKVENYDPYYFSDNSLLEKQYDFITCSEVVEHFYNPRKEFLLLHSLLKKNNSRLAIMTEVLQNKEGFINWWYHKDPTHVCFYEQSTFDWIARWLNFQVEYPDKNIVIYTKNYK
ncbi:MAG: class I SAM-dependent methyltransferase [Candidatus Melainabacteria bacterium]|nr:class I SAM-dependent methyltransferase [Candidatus Melainabacteria bacterium]